MYNKLQLLYLHKVVKLMVTEVSGHCCTLLLSGAEHFFHVLGNHIDLDIDRAAHAVAVHDGALPGVGRNPELEFAVLVNGGNGKGNAIDGNAALVDGVAGKLLRYTHAHHVVLPHGGDGGDSGRAIHMAHDQVAAEPAAGAHGALQIAERALGQCAQGGHAHGLGEQVKLHTVALYTVNGQAAAVHRYRVPQGQLGGKGDFDGVARTLLDRGALLYGAGALYNTGKHVNFSESG